MYPTKKQIEEKLIPVQRCYDYVYNKANKLIKDKVFYPENWQDIRNLIVTKNTKCFTPEYNTLNNAVKSLYRERYRIEENPDLSQIEIDTRIAEIDIAIKKSKELKEIGLKDVSAQLNTDLKDFELLVLKDIRVGAVKSVCDAYKTAISNLKAGNIKYYDISYKKKSDKNKCMSIPGSAVSFRKNGISICPGKWKEESVFRVSKRNYKKYKNLSMSSDCDLTLKNGCYYLIIPVPISKKETVRLKTCGIDPGLRSFLTVYDGEAVTEYDHSRSYLANLNNGIKRLKTGIFSEEKKYKVSGKKRRRRKRRYRKRSFNKIEKKKTDYTNTLHWTVINSILSNYDNVLLGDIKSHDIVKQFKNKTVNREFNDLKFFVFKQRLIYKAATLGKLVKLVDERNTTKCCSSCGKLNHNVGSSKTFNCNYCNLECDRDANAAKNILLKGLN